MPQKSQLRFGIEKYRQGLEGESSVSWSPRSYDQQTTRPLYLSVSNQADCVAVLLRSMQEKVLFLPDEHGDRIEIDAPCYRNIISNYLAMPV